MQGRRRTAQFFPETIENSSAPDIQQNIWSYSVDTSTQPFNVSEYLPARSETSMNYDYRGVRADESYGGYGSYGSYAASDNPWRATSTTYGYPFSTHTSSAGAMTASTSSSSSYSRLFAEDNIASGDDADGYRFLDDRRHSSKRKNFEGQSSQSAGSSSSAAPSRGLSIWEGPSYNDISRNVEASREDFSSAHRADAVSSRLLPPGMWHSHHYSSSFASSFPHLVSNANVPHLPPPSAPSVPQMGYPMTWNGGPNYRIESNNDLYAFTRRETNPRGLDRSSTPDHPDADYFSAFQPVSDVLPALAPSWMPYQGVTGHANSLRTAASQPGIDFRTAQQQLRSAFLMGRQSGIMAAPVTLRSRRTRNMIIFEQIRNALELMQREDSMMIDDVMIMDESEYTDNYSDWRLDVDNMSYEELLALEERIGNVSTGLDESTVLKNMKQRKYLSLSACKPESCCICQEEYEDGEDLGVLSCGHDFHASCVRKWLVQKNICPVCKVTALSK